MAVKLTGQNIKDTYQQLIHSPEGSLVYDGTGSLLPLKFEGNNVKISGSLIANEYVVSSSVTNISIATLSGSTTFGDSSDDTHTFTGNITASGDISASGTISGSKGHFGTITLGTRLNANQIGANGNVGNTEYGYLNNLTGNIQTQFDNLTNVTGSYAVTSSNVLFGNITASGNIRVADASNQPTIINSNGIEFNPNGNANGTNFRVDDTNMKVAINSVEFEVSANKIELGVAANQHVTASGNISSSGEIIAASGSFEMIHGGTF